MATSGALVHFWDCAVPKVKLTSDVAQAFAGVAKICGEGAAQDYGAENLVGLD
jgi:hypothetical protein